jgi:hypothetical protein
MSVKTTGAEWNKFYSDKEAWPDGAWHEDEEILVNGNSPSDDLDLSAVPGDWQMTVANGVVFMDATADDGPSLETHFRRWRKRQITTVLVVEVPHDLVANVRDAIASAGGKVCA